ncbi:preprotein translocase subunit SecG [Clostridium acetireducens DSM 10703]|uniref:Protein-export membrane protein SecG n=1 Tax=Clostridium acetireducens DSM 10703 TaxID=1121290 RepID=A0A1E8EWA6_9CLOT|nr:preprotein translocase subunit SecG [Clostridium acetireducens]OFI01545.1 preprotein translocase subunit SecG [Clostridium acetireducens DSM 10703]
MKTLLVILDVIVCLIIIALVLMQPSKTNGLSGFVTGGAQESFYSKNKSRTSEAALSRATVFFAIIFVLITAALNLVK